MSESTRVRHLGQVRLIRLQIINWGTFRGYKDFPIDERGVLFTGPSGSGKSSLLDALSAVMLPTHDQAFNASADVTARGSKQATRSVADYVRGAWSETNDEHDQSQKRYLRGGKATWSAVAATYDDGLGSVTTAVVVKWFTGTETDGSSLKHLYRLHNGPFDLTLLEEWAAKGFNTRWLRATYPAGDPTTQEQYVRELSRRIGLGHSKTVLGLLGKAKALKNVGDLNLFISDNMLDEPGTFDAAHKMLATFTPLNEAYETARRAHGQERVLHDLPADWTTYRESGDTHTLAESLLGTALDHYVRGLHLRAVQDALDELDEAVTKLDTTLAEQSEHCTRAKEHFTSLDRQFTQQGQGLQDLQQQLDTAHIRHDARVASYKTYAGLVADLGRVPPESHDAFEALQQALPDLVTHAHDELAALRPQRHEAFAAVAQTRTEREEKATELQQLSSARSLIPIREQRRRELLAREAHVEVEHLTYAAELIDIADGQERWRPAAEKVLRSFGLRLLIPEQHRAAVMRVIDEHNMNGVIEYSVVPANATHSAEPEARTLAAKLSVQTDHRYGPWLAGQLARRYNHVCVESARDLDAHTIAVTVQGTVKLPGNHYRKDDRPELTNPASYILGADTAAKIAALTDEVARLDIAYTRATKDAETIDQQYQQHETIVRVGKQLTPYATWDDLDHWNAAAAVTDLEDRIAQLREQNTDLQALEERRDRAEDEWQEALEEQARLKTELNGHTKQQGQLVATLEQEQDKPHTIADDTEREYLDDVFSTLEESLTPDTVRQVSAAARKELQYRRDAASSARDNARARVKSAIERFLEQWPDSAPDTSLDIDRTGADFAALHEDIMQRRLPEAMNRFQQMISEDMVPSISVLQRAIENAAHDIERRIEMVNAGLRRVEFNPGHHLQINFKASTSPDVKEFRRIVDTLLSEAPAARRDNQKLLAQFHRVQKLMRRFTDTDIESRHWRTNVLDVRTSYIFYGVEQDTDGQTQATHRNTAVNSGGEQEKLGAFCLAAALSYNLADVDSEGRPRFAPLMLDEAFSKSDEEYARQALAAFDDFGFQLLIAAPTRMVGILEPFIGQAILVDKRIMPDGAQSAAAQATLGELITRARTDPPAEEEHIHATA